MAGTEPPADSDAAAVHPSGRFGVAVDRMSITPRGPIEYPLGGLPPDKFEALVFLLARDEFPAAVRIRSKDRGLDVRLPDSAGATVRGWQAKRFISGIKWAQCRESARSAIAFWRPPRITFAFATVLSAAEQERFRSELIERFPGVRIDWWDGGEIQRRIRDTEGGQRAAAWLFGNLEASEEKMLRAMAVGGPLEDAGQTAARVAEVQSYVDRDPHFRYTIVSGEGGVAKPPPTADTLISLEAKLGSKEVRFDGSERYPGASVDAGLGGRMIFSEDEDGRRAREALDRAAEGDESVTISSGMKAEFEQVPLGLRGLLPEGPVGGTFTLGPVGGSPSAQSEPGGLSVLVRCGGAEVGIVLVPLEPPEGQAGALVGSVGGMEFRLDLHGPPPEGDVGMSWRWQRGEGTALEQSLAAKVMLAACRGERVEIYDPRLGEVVAAAELGHVADLEDWIEDLEQTIVYLGFVVEAEAWIGGPLHPPGVPSDADAEVLSTLISRIRNPKVDGTWERVGLTMTERPPHERFVAALIRPVYVELFGETHYVGGELVTAPEAQLAPEHVDAEPGEEVAIVPGEDDSIKVLFEPPADAPEAALLSK